MALLLPITTSSNFSVSVLICLCSIDASYEPVGKLCFCIAVTLLIPLLIAGAVTYVIHISQYVELF